jgi:hypothetical protein
MLRILPAADGAKASISFLTYSHHTILRQTWTMGNNAWGVGSGNFGIGKPGLNLVMSIDGNTGNINATKSLSANGSRVATQSDLSNYYTSGQVYTKAEIDSAIDQKYTFSNPGTNRQQRWLKLGTVTYPTSLLSNSLYTVLRITFIQNIIANEEYTMTVLFKFSNLALTSDLEQPQCMAIANSISIRKVLLVRTIQE